MKKLILFVLTTIFAVGCTPKGYEIEGDITGLTGKVYLATMQGKTPVIVDSSAVDAQGKFEFKGAALSMPILAALQSEDKRTIMMFMLENSQIEIEGDIEQREEIEVEGSAEDSLFRKINSKMKGVKDMDEYKVTISEFVKANPKSIAAAYVLFRQLTPYLDYNEMRQYVAGMDSAIKGSIYLTLIEDRAKMMEQTSVGKNFVDFSAQTPNGEVVALGDVAGKDKWVLLDFWASWCGPCRRENPNVVKAYNEYKDKGFTVFGYSLDKEGEADKWVAAIEKDSLNWTNISDLMFWESAPVAAYGVSSIPSNVMIAPDGTIAARNLKGEELMNFLAENLL